MKDYFDIPEDFDDLEKYAPNLAKIARQNPFGVPEGYFDENERFISSHIQLIFNKNEGGFTVPDGYFEELQEVVQDRIFLEDLTTSEVPEGYFEELPDLIQSRIFLDSLHKENAFATPENYFENLPGHIQSRLALEEIKKGKTFVVPEGYFDALPGIIEERIARERKAQPRIIALFRSNFGYVAAAASIVLVIGLSIFFNQVPDPHVSGSGMAARQGFITKQDIREYLCDNLDESALMELAAAGDAGEEKEEELNVVEQLDEQEVIDYLIDNNVDVNEL
jgi:hypothetical protein